MQHEKKGKKFIKQPKFIGGQAALKKLVSKELTYPKEALEKKIEGTVKVSYTLNHKGNVIETKVLSKLGYGCDEEAVRIIKLFKFDVPKNRGVRVLFHKQIGINFRLPKEPVAPKKPVVEKAEVQGAAPSVQYHYTPTRKVKQGEPKKKKGYEYTVNL